MRPSEAGFAPSMSLPRSMASASSASRAPAGSGVCRMIPCTPAAALSSASTAPMLAAAFSGASAIAGLRSMTSHPIPAFAAAVASDRTYQALASSAVAVTMARRGGRPAPVSSAAWAAVPARMSAASSRPDSNFPDSDFPDSDFPDSDFLDSAFTG
jgi:hypothetical protein